MISTFCEPGNAITPEIPAGEIQSQENEVEMPIYDFTTIETATNYFSFSNKIGEGGFGPVYKVVFLTNMFVLILISLGCVELFL